MPESKLARIAKLVESSDLSAEEELQLLRSLALEDSAALAMAVELLVRQRRTLRRESAQAQAQLAKLEAVVGSLGRSPWYPATVLRPTDDGRVDLVSGGSRQIVAVAPELAPNELAPGQEVFVNGDGIVVARSEAKARTGLVGSIAEVGIDGVLVRGSGDEELRCVCPPELLEGLRVGDRVVYGREFPLVVERLPERTQNRWLLETPRPVRFEEIGGLDGVIGTLCREIDLHLFHPDQVSAFQLTPMRGFLLTGPPGVGKTLIAKAIASHLHRVDADTRFMHVPPGSIRGMYYGQAESRIREIFGVARAAPGLVVIFMDELDSYGARGVGIGQDIDGRVLGALLDAIDGLDSARNVLCIGATNRMDLCDEALVRSFRFGDRVFQLPRPGREATRQILRIYLRPDLPFAEGEGPEAAEALVDAAVSYLHAPEGGAGGLATVTLRNSEKREIAPAAVLSGALLASAVERAKHAAAHRALEGKGGLALEDLLAALDEGLTAEARKLAAPHVARRMLDFDEADEIVCVELPPQRRVRRHRYLRAA